MLDPHHHRPTPERRSWARTILDPFFTPLLILLHLVFTFSSLILRIYELLTTPEPTTTTSSSALGSGAARSASPTGSDIVGGDTSASTAAARKRWVPPKHVGMVLLPPSPAQRAQWTGSAIRSASGKGDGKEGTSKALDKRARARREILDRAVESVLNLVEMAGEEGVAEVSVYEATGALIRMLSSDEVRMRGDRC